MQFKDIVGQRVLINHLTEIIDSGRVSHAQLFMGTPQSGTVALAIAYMQYLCCQHRQQHIAVGENLWTLPDGSHSDLRADSCGSCPSCRKFEALQHPDLHFVFPNIIGKSDITSSEEYVTTFIEFLQEYHQCGTLEEWYHYLGVENKQGMIRERDAANIVRYINDMPYEAPYKMVLLWCAEKMNIAAANELLKTLEEPSGNALLLLIEESTERLLPTIVSRVQQVTVPSIGNEHDSREQEFAAWFVDWTRMLFKLNIARINAWVDQISKEGREVQKQFLSFCLEALRQCLLCNVTNGAQQPTINFGDEKFNKSFYTVITPNNITQMNDAINHTIMAISRNAHPAVAFMTLSFKMSSYISKK